MIRRLPVCVAASVVAVCALGTAAEPVVVPHGRLETLNGYTVVSVEGTPEEMGTAYGKLLGPTIQRVVKAVITDGACKEPDARANIIKASRVMERFQPPEFIAELKAIAAAASVPYDDLLVLQYFGDVRRCITGPGSASMCCSFAILPPLTRERVCLVGRSFEYFDEGVGEYASLLAYHRPRGRIPFVTITWAGVINGWTLLNEKGIVCSNNTAFGAKSQSLKGISTCTMLRYVAERAATVAEGIELVTKGPRACATIMLVASGNPPDGAILEFDHDKLVVRRPEGGFVGGANSYFKLYQESAPPGRKTSASETRTPEGAADADPYWGRIKAARDLALGGKGKLDFSWNLGGAEGVPIVSISLHAATIDATNLRFKVSMGKTPACQLPPRAFRLTNRGLEALKE
ncbi:MAG: hypothetical protein FJ290_23040 [Planctomycetes bacterium]|nr:hypothetical protein [Planctomycetota bacterium]